jgi:hypothetical protein
MNKLKTGTLTFQSFGLRHFAQGPLFTALQARRQ